MINVLIAEDNKTKLDNIIKVLEANNISYKFKTTYSECWNEIAYDYEDYDALILDMSLPRFKNETAHKFAGYDILRRISYEKIDLPVIVITGHVQFTVDKKIYNLDDVINMIEKNDRIPKTEIVKYDNISKAWQFSILDFLKSLGTNNENTFS